MPTKASEYMISGTPILSYSPKETALSKFFLENECAYCVSEKDPHALEIAIKYLISNSALRMNLSHNAIAVAIDKFDAIKVRSEFHKQLLSLTNF